MCNIFLIKFFLFIMVPGNFAIAQENLLRDSLHKRPGVVFS